LGGTINDSARSVRRTVSGLALRKTHALKDGNPLDSKEGSRFLISMIFSPLDREVSVDFP